MAKVKAIIPKDLLFHPDKIMRALENALTGAALDVKVDLQVTTRTWSEKNKPTFKITKKRLGRTIYTYSKIYSYVDEGTPPHTIKAKTPGKPLAFRVPYKAKTAPRVIASKTGGVGAEWKSAYEVEHPGTEAREFTDTIQEKWERELPKITQRAIDSEVD
jgi:hypothetical protein